MAARQRQEGVTAMRLAVVAAVAVVVVGRPAPAVAGCAKIAGGLFRSDGCVEASGVKQREEVKAAAARPTVVAAAD